MSRDKSLRKTKVAFEFPVEVPGNDGPKPIILRMEVLPEGRILLREKDTPRGASLQTSAAKVYLQTMGRVFHSLPVS